jgi:lipopolysaccharide transport system permease protein
MDCFIYRPHKPLLSVSALHWLGGLNPEAPVLSAIDARPVTIRSARGRGLFASLRELSDYTDLFRTLTEHRIRVRYKQSLLGPAWAILQPLSMMLIFTLVFGRAVRVQTNGVPYPVFAFSGLLLWSFMSTGLSNCTHALVAHAQLLTKVYFPREILPFSYIAAALFDLSVGTSVLLVLMAFYHQPLSLYLFLALPSVVVAACLATALALALSALQVRFRDVGLAVPLALYLWMFVTPVAYPLSAFPERYRWIFALNPLAGLIQAFRQAALEQRVPDFALLLPGIVATAILLPLGYGIFKHAEKTMADVV